MKTRPYILTIAGFDPTSGAGLTADIKTFEKLKCYGLAVCTANTVQNDVDFLQCDWNSLETIKSQIEVLFNRFEINIVKIGIVENWKVLNDILDFLHTLNPTIKIVLDPVLRSSSEFTFHESNAILLEEVLSKIYLLTPNAEEIKNLFPEKDRKETIKIISGKTNLLLKGGHNKEMLGVDELFTNDGKHFKFNPKDKNCTEKHGSGCVLSSAIATYILKDYSLMKACYKGKMYTEKVLSSNKSLLGYHY